MNYQTHTQYTRTIVWRATLFRHVYNVCSQLLAYCCAKLPHTLTPLCSFHFTHNSISVSIRLQCMDNKISWHGGWASQWHPPHHHHPQLRPLHSQVIWKLSPLWRTLYGLIYRTWRGPCHKNTYEAVART